MFLAFVVEDKIVKVELPADVQPTVPIDADLAQSRDGWHFGVRVQEGGTKCGNQQWWFADPPSDLPPAWCNAPDKLPARRYRLAYGLERFWPVLHSFKATPEGLL